MKLNKETLKRIIKEELDNALNEAGDFNPQYRMQQMMKGRGRVMMAVKDPYSDENAIYNSGYPETDPTLQKIHSALLNADTVANRIRTGDMEEAKRIGKFSAQMFQEAEEMIRADLRPAADGGLQYMSSMVEGAAAHMFIVRLIGIIKSL